MSVNNLVQVTFPSEWRFVPILKGKKAPIATEEGNWADQGKPWEKIHPLFGTRIKGFSETRKKRGDDPWFVGQVGAIGVLCGRNSGGLLLLDHDGVSCTDLIKKWGELPNTWVVSSGKLGHCQYAFRVPEMFWDAIANTQHKSTVIVDGKEVQVKDADGKDEHVELRWDGQQSLVFGEHPETKRNYEWFNTEKAIAEAPIWLIEKMLKPEYQHKPNEHESQVEITAPRNGRPSPIQSFREKTDQDWAAEYLKAIDPSALDWYEWRNCLLAAHQAGLTESEVERWSATSPKHTGGGFSDVWRHIKGKEGGLGLGTLGFLAKQHGWHPQSKSYNSAPNNRPKTLQESQESPISQINGYAELRLAVSGILALKDPLEREDELINLSRRSSRPLSHLKKIVGDITKRENNNCTSLTLGDLQKMESKGTQWLIPRFLPMVGLSLLGGFAKDGKTTLLWDMTRALLSGEPFLNQAPIKPVRVLMVQCEETNDGRLSERAESVGLIERPELAEALRIEKNWTIDDLDTLEQWIVEHQADVVIIDSLRKVSARNNIPENSQEFASPVYELQGLLNAMGKSGILIHHTKKNSQEGATWMEKYAGSSALLGACDNLMGISRASQDPNDNRRKINMAGRDCKGEHLIEWKEDEFPRFHYDHLLEMGISSDERNLQARILEVMSLNYHNHPEVTASFLKNVMDLDCDDKSIYRPLKQLVDGQLLSARRKEGDARIKLYSLPTPPSPLGSVPEKEKNDSNPYISTVFISSKLVANNSHATNCDYSATNLLPSCDYLATNGSPDTASISAVPASNNQLVAPSQGEGGWKTFSEDIDPRFVTTSGDAKPRHPRSVVTQIPVSTDVFVPICLGSVGAMKLGRIIAVEGVNGHSRYQVQGKNKDWCEWFTAAEIEIYDPSEEEEF